MVRSISGRPWRLRRDLEARGHSFRSDTDTEVIPHLLEESYRGDLKETVEAVLPTLEGSYAFLVLSNSEERIIAARQSSPLVIGIGDGEYFAASDMTPILDYTANVIFLEDGDLVNISTGGVSVYHAGMPVDREIQRIEWSVDDVNKGGFRHYMQKEIFEQPDVFTETIRGLVQENSVGFIRESQGMSVVACGTSYHAALIFRYLMEERSHIQVRVELASEFKYFPPPMGDLVIGVSQSGETADTLAALKIAQMHSARTLAITNVLGSSITRVAEFTVFTRAGPEISVGDEDIYGPAGGIPSSCQWIPGRKSFMLTMITVHVFFGIQLTLANHRAKPVTYAVKKSLRATFAGKSMIWSGAVVGIFVLFHLGHFTLQIIFPEHAANRNMDIAGRPNVFGMVIYSFQNLLVSLIYGIAVAALFFTCPTA